MMNGSTKEGVWSIFFEISAALKQLHKLKKKKN